MSTHQSVSFSKTIINHFFFCCHIKPHCSVVNQHYVMLLFHSVKSCVFLSLTKVTCIYGLMVRSWSAVPKKSLMPLLLRYPMLMYFLKGNYICYECKDPHLHLALVMIFGMSIPHIYIYIYIYISVCTLYNLSVLFSIFMLICLCKPVPIFIE